MASKPYKLLFVVVRGLRDYLIRFFDHTIMDFLPSILLRIGEGKGW